MPKRWFLSKKDIKRLKKDITGIYPSVPLEFKRVERVVEKNYPEILIVDRIPAFFIYEGKYYPLLVFLLAKGVNWMPRVMVDMGAVKPLMRGADIMAPGVRDVIGVFNIGDPVAVIDEKYKKPFVIGKALVNSNDLITRKIVKGKVIKNIHRAGDKLWNLSRSL